MSDRDSTVAGESVGRRASGHRVVRWVLLDGDRHAVAAVVLAGAFLGLVGASQVASTPLRAAVATSDPVETTFQAFVGALITGVTLVVTIAQLVLSQEQGPLGDQRERMDGALAFREDVESALERAASPAEPAGLLRAILESIESSSEELADRVDAVADPAVRERLETYADDVALDARVTAAELADAQFGTFAVVRGSLRFNYGVKVHDGRAFQRAHAEALPAGVRDALDDVVRALNFYGPAREHVKTLYFQWELMDLSREILYAAVPALLVSVAMILFGDDPSLAPGATVGLDNLVLLVAGAVTVALAPFVVLLSYVLRIASVTKRTLAIGPTVLRETDGSADEV